MSDYEASMRSLDRGLAAPSEADAPGRPGGRRGRQGRFGEPPGPGHRDAASGQKGLTRYRIRQAMGGVLEPARAGRPLDPEIKAGIDTSREAPLFASWEEFLDHFATRLTDALAPMRSGLVNKVLFSGLVVLGPIAGGAGSQQYQFERNTAPYGGVLIANLSGQTVTVSNSPSANLPTTGLGGAANGNAIPGTLIVPPARWIAAPLVGTSLLFFAPAAGVVQLNVVLLLNAPTPGMGISA